ncbi:hypothetical protein B0H14DRAFT_1204992 [Mycena olivaceomarginata]|nr:hypothetical protein B0H14DRAFT_1204992 [Mycena olivaceomarginata]
MGATPGTTSPPSVPTSPPVPMYPVPRVNDTGFYAPVYGYLSDVESSESDSDSGDEGGDESETRAQPVRNERRKLDVPVREQVRLKKEKRAKDRHNALTAVEKVIGLKRTEYQGPLQAKRAQVIQSTLHLVVRNSRSLMEASAMAAETHGFAAIWGSRLARKWTAEWVKRRELPESERGRHAKTWSLLQDPEIKEELVAYLRSNKWSMDPAKLVQYSESQMVTAEMRKYVQTAVNKEMPRGLKKYPEVELFPRIGYKVSRGISLATARRWLHKQGFEYMEVKKGLFMMDTSAPMLSLIAKMCSFPPSTVYAHCWWNTMSITFETRL